MFGKDNSSTPLNFGFKRISTAASESGQDAPHQRLAFDGSEQIEITEPGYVYIYISNENGTPVEVYFDDFKVTHVKSPIVQSNDYYPFGLALNSYQRENSVDQNYLYNGKELQDELDLGWVDYGARNYQPDLGRYFSLDRFSDIYSPLTPYQYGSNNPALFVDINGDSLLTAFSNTAAMLAFARQVLESLDGGNFKLTFTSTGQTNENGTMYYNVGLEGGNKEKLSDGAKVFYRGLKGVIDDNDAVKIGVVYGQKNTDTGRFDKALLDMADVEQWPNFDHSKTEQRGPTDAGKIIHEIREQYRRVKYGQGYDPAHGTVKYPGSALYYEDAVNGNTRLTNVDIGNNTIVQQFELKNKSVVKYQVVINRGVIIVKPYNGKRGIQR